MFLYQTPGRRPPRITGRAVNTVNRGCGSEPVTSAPRSEFMTQSLVLSIRVCRGLRISPLRIKHFAECFSGRSCPNIRPGIASFVFLFLQVWTFCKDFVLIASGKEISRRASLKLKLFHGKSRHSISIGFNLSQKENKKKKT